MKDIGEPEGSTVSKDSKVTPSILDAFGLLRESKDEVRAVGGAKIISLLQGNENEKNVQYVVKRLVRSLGANIPDMRTGYFATLVTLLTKFDHITVSQLLELTKKELHANGSSKSEVGDVALGQILVCGAIFRSGLILTCSSEEQQETVEVLLKASRKKSYLSTVAYLVFMDMVNGLDEKQFSTILWPHIKVEFKKPLAEYTLDSLYFLLVTSRRFPAKVKPGKLIGFQELLGEDTVLTICEKLMAGIDFNSVGHPIYKEVATQIANSPHLEQFWTAGIDSQLVKHNRNREIVALNILTNVLNSIQENVEAIPELMSKNFFKLSMDWFKGLQTASKIRNKRDDEEDHKIMIKKEKELLNALAKAMKSDKVTKSVRVATLKKLLFSPGEINFTEITGTNVVKAIMADLDVHGVKKMAKLFKGVLLNSTKKTVKEDQERSWYNNERLKAAEFISYLVSHEAVKEETEFKLTYMKLLMDFGFFKVGGDDNVAVSAELSGSIKSCFYRCFTSRFSTVDSLVEVLTSLTSTINSALQKEQIRVKLEKQFPKENTECWETLMELCDDIQTHESKSKVDKVFLVLLYQLGLFLFSEPNHVKMATSSIKELKSCYEHYKKGKKKKNEISNQSDLTTEDPEWIEVLVEVLLSILSTESSVLRSVVQCVFRLLWEYLTPSSIGQIVSVLDPESETNPLTQDSDSEDEQSDEEKETDEAEASGNADEAEKSDSESQDSDSGLDEDDEEMKTPDQLRMAVQKALGAAADSDNESIDADMIDEEEGKKLDTALAEAFKQFHQGKGRQKKKERKDKKQLSDFRIRVLDLIDIYLEKDPSMDICLGMMAPLMRCLEFCIQDSQFSELENRLRKTIKILAKVRKFSSTDDVTMEVLCDYLKSTIDKGSRSHFLFQAVGDIITHFATFIVHCSLKVSYGKQAKKATKTAPLVEIFKENLQSYFTNRNCMLPIIFFHNVLQTDWEGSYDLVPIITENVFNKNVRQFRRNEGLDLIAGFYRSLKRIRPASDAVLSKLSRVEKHFEDVLQKSLKGEEVFVAKNNFYNFLRKVIKNMLQYHESCKVPPSADFKLLLDIVGSCKPVKGKENGTPHKHDGTTDEKKNKPNKKKKNKKRKNSEQINGHVGQQKKKVRKESVRSVESE